MFKANTNHPLFSDIHNIILKYAGIDRLIEDVVEKIGNVHSVYLVGSFARGLESQVIDIIVVGDVNVDYFVQLLTKAEVLIGKKIKFLLCSEGEFESSRKDVLSEEHLLIWSSK